MQKPVAHEAAQNFILYFAEEVMKTCAKKNDLMINYPFLAGINVNQVMYNIKWKSTSNTPGPKGHSTKYEGSGFACDDADGCNSAERKFLI